MTEKFSSIKKVTVQMTNLVLPAHVRQAMRSAAQVAESVEIHTVMEQAVQYLFGEIDEADIKHYARAAQVQFPTYQEAIDALGWVICESVRMKCTVNDFIEFISTVEFLNNEEVLSVYQKSVARVRQSLAEVSPDSEHYVSSDWRLQVEVARRSLRAIRRPHVVLDLKTTNHTHTVELTPGGLVELYTALEGALQSCRTAKFRRIQRFVK